MRVKFNSVQDSRPAEFQSSQRLVESFNLYGIFFAEEFRETESLKEHFRNTFLRLKILLALGPGHKDTEYGT